MEDFLHYKFEGLIFGAAYTWRGLFSEFYSTYTYKLNTLLVSLCSKKIIKIIQSNPALWMPALYGHQGLRDRDKNIYIYIVNVRACKNYLKSHSIYFVPSMVQNL